jgi:D-alanine-D-alanine ligase
MAKQKIRVAVLYGGPSAEHNVSLKTGTNAIEAIKKIKGVKYSVRPVKISKRGEWFVNNKKFSPTNALKNIDVVFNAMHGEFGEDGTVQGFLDTLKIPYTGAGQRGSMIGMDKILSKLIFLANNIKTAPFAIARKGEPMPKLSFSFPVVIKPAGRGSSVGVSIAKNKKELESALKLAFKFDKDVLLEKFIKGREITVGVLENFKGKKYYALPITEIRPKVSDFFDYKAKYEIGGSEEITPAPINKKLTKKAQDLAVKVFKILEARHYSRIDMIIQGENLYVLEINTLPGMTATSLMPQQARKAGLNLSQLIDHLIGLALKK